MIMAVLIDKFEITIGNKSFDEYEFVDVVLLQELLSPGELRFTMRKKSLLKSNEDIDFKISDDLLGSEVKLQVTSLRRDEKENTCNESLDFKGIIFGLSAQREMMSNEVVILVTAFSPDHLLIDNPHCYSFEELTLRDIVSKSISDYSKDIATEVNPKMTSTIPYVVQYNENTYQFLSRLAQRYGEFFYFEDGKMVFGKISQQDKITLYPNVDISGYHYELNLGHSNFSHCCHNYLSYENSSENAHTYTGNSLSKLTDYTYDHSRKIYKKETIRNFHSGTQENNTTGQLEESLKAQGLGNKTQMMICRATTNRADLRLGSKIMIQEFSDNDNGGMDKRNHEELLVCQIHHRLNLLGHYENDIIGIPANTDYPPYSNSDAYPAADPQRAIVKDNKDPKKLGRIRVQFIWQEVQDKNMWTPWLRIAQPHGGNDKGFYFIPEISEEVMVGFENGNAEKPYVTGTLYHGTQVPESNWYNDSNDIKGIRTKSGHTVEFYDTHGQEYIRIYDNKKENYILTYSTYEKLIKLESKGNIELYADKDIVMHAKNNIEMKADKDMNRKAGDNISESAGKNIAVDAGKNISTDAGDDISVSAGKNMTESAGKNMDISVSDNQTLSVGKNQSVDVSKNKDESVGKNYTLDAENIIEKASQKLQMQSQTHEQKADATMKIDGGNQIDIKATMAKIN
jgi:type VI secretion system secreted protein VgrG